jgi:predicted phosphodiesterase
VRYLILSDLHANLQATSRVLEDAASRGYDRVIVLGDLVGYGANPGEVIDRIRALDPFAVVRGNHDKVVSGITDGEFFNEVAHEAALWTRSVLGREHPEYLRGLPEGPAQVDGFVISHGTPLDEEEYLLGNGQADDVFVETEFDLAFFGHTHFPCAFEEGDGPGRMMRTGESSVRLAPGARYLVNPGSVGQPRDRDPRASYVTFDTGSREIAWHRVEYDCEEAKARIVKAGLPPVLGERLTLGV